MGITFGTPAQLREELDAEDAPQTRLVRQWRASSGCIIGLGAYLPLEGQPPRPHRVVIAAHESQALDVRSTDVDELLTSLPGHGADVRSLAVYTLGGHTRIACGFADGTLTVWDGDSYEPLQTHRDAHAGEIKCLLAWEGGDGRAWLASACDAEVKVWDGQAAAQGREVLQGLGDEIVLAASRAVWGGSGSWLVAGDENGALSMCDPEAGGIVRRLGGHGRKINDVKCIETGVDPSCLLIISGSQDVRIWEGETGRLVITLASRVYGHADFVLSVAPYLERQGGKLRIATGGDDCSVKIWDGETGAVIRTLRGHTMGVHSLQVYESERGDLRLLSGSYDSHMRLWDLERGRFLTALRGHRGFLMKMHLFASEDGRYNVISGDDDYGTVLWDLEPTSLRAETMRAATKLG
jgi:WD40 repeat protein